MGQEIDSSQFTKHDFQQFSLNLQQETALLASWFREHRLAVDPSIGGFELEAWLVDRDNRPAPINQRYLERLNNPLVVPELALFNVEFNTPERRLEGAALNHMQEELTRLWHYSDRIAGEFNARLAMVGILPTVREQELNSASMTPRARYRALNEQVLRLRHGRPLRLAIEGTETLHIAQGDFMLEAAATSFQIHLQVQPGEAATFFNTALVLSAPMVAATANSPYLFGKALWEETRIPLFEQAVAVGGDIDGSDPAYRRVTFGSGYLQASLLELFQENLRHYPPLLPECMDTALEKLHHIRLHNGTIWRWNRPLIGFDKGGNPHLRIEHRVVPAGPSIPDMIANAALFYGLLHSLGRAPHRPEPWLSFAQSRANFYSAARDGLRAEVVWLKGKRVGLQTLLLQELLPLAKQGLETLDIQPADIDTYLGIIAARLRSGQTGAAWQRAYVAKHGRDMQALTAAYLKQQRSGLPVHEWGLAC
jgi:hypothetical protein